MIPPPARMRSTDCKRRRGHLHQNDTGTYTDTEYKPTGPRRTRARARTRTKRPPRLTALLPPLAMMATMMHTIMHNMHLHNMHSHSHSHSQSAWFLRQQHRSSRSTTPMLVSALVVVVVPPPPRRRRGGGTHGWQQQHTKEFSSSTAIRHGRYSSNNRSLLRVCCRTSPGTMTMAMARTASLSLSSSASSSNNRSNSNSNSSNETTPVTPPPNERARLLNRNNESTPAAEIMEAAIRSLRDPSSGYDQRFGRPALRAYRSFVYPKKLPYNLQLQLQLQLQSTGNGSREEDDDDDGDDDNNNNNNNNNGRPGTTSVNEDPIQLEAAAQRTANQIDFLIKRQTSKRMEAIRNHDPETLRNNDDDDDDDDDTSSSSQRRRRRRSNTVFPIALVLDNLRGSFNVGSIFRTAEACGVREILTCGITPHPNGSGAEKVAKSALGADMLVPSRHFATTRQALEALKGNHNKNHNKNNNSNSNNNHNSNDADADENNHDHLVVALETTAASHLYTSFDFQDSSSSSSSSSNNNDKEDNNNQRRRYGGGIALVLGNEVTGVDAELFAHLLPTPDDNDNDSDSDNEQTEAGTKTITTKTNSKTGPVDVIVELPTYGQKNSLNVAAHGTARHGTKRTNERTNAGDDIHDDNNDDNDDDAEGGSNTTNANAKADRVAWGAELFSDSATAYEAIAHNLLRFNWRVKVLANAHDERSHGRIGIDIDIDIDIGIDIDRNTPRCSPRSSVAGVTEDFYSFEEQSIPVSLLFTRDDVNKQTFNIKKTVAGSVSPILFHVGLQTNIPAAPVFVTHPACRESITEGLHQTTELCN
eukprot:jgi/Psemu1/56158/gm1.56158_g